MNEYINKLNEEDKVQAIKWEGKKTIILLGKGKLPKWFSEAFREQKQDAKTVLAIVEDDYSTLIVKLPSVNKYADIGDYVIRNKAGDLFYSNGIYFENNYRKDQL